MTESNPLPLIEDIFDAMAGAQIFIKLHAESGYHQILMKEEDKAKTAFSHWRCERSFFQRIMDSILRDYLCKFAVVYLDDIIIFSKNKTEHQEHLRLVKDRLSETGLKVNWEKCKFNENKIEALGHTISGLESRVETIKKFRPHKNLKELQSFLGLVNFCRKVYS